MAIDKTPGLIIKRNNFRETSIIATFYTRDFGKINGLLKGARSDLKKFGSRIEPFTNNDIVFYRKTRGEIHLISQCDLIDNFDGLQKDLDKLNLSSYAAKLIDVIMPQEDKNEAVFNLLIDFFKTLSASEGPNSLESLFEIKLLALSGFKPYLDACISCSKQIDKNIRFSMKLGGLICDECSLRDLGSEKISEGSIASLLHLEKRSWPQSLRLKLSKAVENELSKVLKGFLSYHTGVELKALVNKEA